MELLSLWSKSLLIGDPKSKNPALNSQVSNPSGEKLFELFNNNDFHISVPQHSPHYTSQGTGDVFDIVLNKHVRLSDVIISGILDSSHTNIFPHNESS
jgi:hypothetical protein